MRPVGHPQVTTGEYGYDATDQLTQVSLSQARSRARHYKNVLNYQARYDLVGNRVFDSNTGHAAFTANQITRTDARVYLSDEDGFGRITQQIKGGRKRTYAYRPDGKLTRFEQSYDQDQDGISDEDDVITQVRYAYDALDRRVSKEVTQQKFKYVKQKSKPKKPHPKETFTQRFTYLGFEDRIVLARAGDQTLSLYLDGQGIDEHLGVASEKDVFAYETDHLGSVLNTDPAGSLRGYGAFGETIGFGPWITKHSDPVMYGFAGRAYDAESDLYYNRARMYDPTTGRFMTKDPLEPQQGGDINPYRYALNNPAKFVDPDGREPITATMIVGGAVVGGVAAGATVYISGADARTVAISASVGAIAGAASLGVSAFATTATGIIVSNAAIGGISSAATQVALGTPLNQLNYTSVGIGMAAGGIGGAAGLGAGTAAFYNTPVIGRQLGNAAARGNEYSTSLIVGAGVSTGLEAGGNYCR